MFWIRTRPIFYPFLRLVLLCSPLAKSKSKETKSQTNLRFIDHWKYVLTCFVVIFSDKCDLERNLFTPSSPLIYSASASPLSYCLRLHKCLHMQNTNNMMNKQIKSPGDVFWQIRSWNLFTPGWPLLLFWTLCWPLLIICSASASPLIRSPNTLQFWTSSSFHFLHCSNWTLLKVLLYSRVFWGVNFSKFLHITGQMQCVQL